VKDDRCSISENSPLLRYLTTREEDLSEDDDVSFEHLSTLLRHGVECGFEDVALVEVRSVVVRVFTLHA
jgi:hypothetical protein